MPSLNRKGTSVRNLKVDAARERLHFLVGQRVGEDEGQDVVAGLEAAESDLAELEVLRIVRAADVNGLNGLVEDRRVAALEDEPRRNLRLAAFELRVIDDGAEAQVVLARDLPQSGERDGLLAARLDRVQEDAAHRQALLAHVRHFEILRQSAELARLVLAHGDAQLVAARLQLDVPRVAESDVERALVLVGRQRHVERLAEALLGLAEAVDDEADEVERRVVLPVRPLLEVERVRVNAEVNVNRRAVLREEAVLERAR